jgi:hypothetical protein
MPIIALTTRDAPKIPAMKLTAGDYLAGGGTRLSPWTTGLKCGAVLANRQVERIRSETNGVKADVHYTPIEGLDKAHADLTIEGTDEDNLGAVRDWLQEVLRVSKPAPNCVLDKVAARSAG